MNKVPKIKNQVFGGIDFTNTIFMPTVTKVESARGVDSYLVTHSRPTKWRCTCPDFVYRSIDDEGYATGHKCKHIKAVMQQEELP